MKNYLKILPFLIVIVFSMVAFQFADTEEIISLIGLENAYLLILIFAFLAGLSALNAAPYYYLLFLLVNAGLNPTLLGTLSGMAIMVGDSFVYFLGNESKNVLPEWISKYLDTIANFASNYPKLFPVFCFMYGCFSPFSNNFITIAAGLAKIPFYRIMIPLGMGNIIFNIGLAYLVIYANDFVTAFIS